MYPDICANDLEAFGLTAGASSYKSDSLWNYETGLKTRWLDGHLSANIALYDMEWSNIQETVVLPCGFSATVNGAAARSQGSELEFLLAPVEGLTLGVSGGYEDAKITGVKGQTSLYVGQPLNGVPRWNGTFNATFELPTEQLGKMFARMDVDYVGQSFSLNNSPVNGRIRPDYTLLNARVGTRFDKFDVSAYAKNICNAHPNLGDEISEIVELPGRPRYVIGAPRTIGLEARLKF